MVHRSSHSRVPKIRPNIRILRSLAFFYSRKKNAKYANTAGTCAFLCPRYCGFQSTLSRFFRALGGSGILTMGMTGWKMFAASAAKAKLLSTSNVRAPESIFQLKTDVKLRADICPSLPSSPSPSLISPFFPPREVKSCRRSGKFYLLSSTVFLARTLAPGRKKI